MIVRVGGCVFFTHTWIGCVIAYVPLGAVGCVVNVHIIHTRCHVICQI